MQFAYIGALTLQETKEPKILTSNKQPPTLGQHSKGDRCFRYSFQVKPSPRLVIIYS